MTATPDAADPCDRGRVRTTRGVALAAATTAATAMVLAACVPGHGEGPPGPQPERPGAYRVVLPAPPVTTDDAAPCTPDQLDFVLEAPDRATGNGWVSLRTTNRSDVPCTLTGPASLVVEQGGRELDLTLDHGTPGEPVRLERQQSASAEVFWRGYGTAADQDTPQAVRVVLADGWTDDVALGTAADDPLFDLVDGGALTVGPWVALGYGPPAYDVLEVPVESDTPCVAADLVAGIGDVEMPVVGDTESSPVVSFWVANVGVLPCRTGDLVLVGPDGDLPLDDGRGTTTVRPGDAVVGTAYLDDVEPALADSGPWSLRAGGVVVPLLPEPS